MLQSGQAKGANRQPLARQVEACTADDEADARINPPCARESKAVHRHDKNKIDDAFGQKKQPQFSGCSIAYSPLAHQ
jgi:hypothetical protein